MELELTVGKITYRLMIRNKFNVIVGKSGTGKSRLKAAVETYMDKPSICRWTGEVDICTLEGTKGKSLDELIKDGTQRIIVIDEEDMWLLDKDRLKQLKRSVHIAIIMRRHLPKEFDYKPEDVYTLEKIEDGVIRMVPLME